MTDRLTACLLTGQEAHPDGTCREHGGRHCVITVLLTTRAHECVIPGYECTHGHHDVRPVEWPSLDEPPRRRRTDPTSDDERP